MASKALSASEVHLMEVNEFKYGIDSWAHRDVNSMGLDRKYARSEHMPVAPANSLPFSV